MDNHFDTIARVELAGPPTPLQEMSRLKAALETTGLKCPRLLVKREDLTQTAGGGNKIRKLEYLLADAKASGADTIITAGALQSNHVRQTAGAAARLGLDCIGLLFATVPNKTDAYTRSGNVLLDDVFGADIRIFPHDANGRDVFDAVLAEMVEANRKAYVIPVGGSSDVGCLGYVRVFRELMSQVGTVDQDGGAAHIVVANGSSGTQAGLAAGACLYAPHMMVHGINVLSPEADKAKDTTAALAAATMKLAEPQRASSLSPDDILLHSGFMGDGYGIPTPEMIASLQLVARTEGLLLDPVYSGKAMSGMIGLIQAGMFDVDDTVIFIATGGTPGLFAYVDNLTEPQS